MITICKFIISLINNKIPENHTEIETSEVATEDLIKTNSSSFSEKAF